MRNSLKFQLWGRSSPYLDSCPKLSDGICEAPSAKAPSHTEASFNSFVDEPRVQPSDPAGEVQFISQNGPRGTQQHQPYQTMNLKNKDKRLSKSLAGERVSSQESAFKLHSSEMYNGRPQMSLAAHKESSERHDEAWNVRITTEQHSKVSQEGAAALRKESQAQKEAQGAMEALKVAHEKLAQDLHKTREQLAASQQELRACKDDLFRLQPVAQLTDADISRDFESLCQRINDWIEGEMSSFEDAYPNAKPGQMFSADGKPELRRLMQKYSDVGEYLVRNMVHHHLQEIMFDSDVFLFGIPLNMARLLQGAEQSMAMLEPRREYTTINTWRSETLTALLAHEDFAIHRRRRLDEASRHIFRQLSSVFSIIDLECQSFARFYNKVMFPAAELASKIQSSASTYEFVMLKDLFPNLEPLHKDHLATDRIVDVETRKTLKPESKVVCDSHGFIGKAILPLEPRLHRKNRGQQNTTLYQACYLVKLDKPLLKDNKALA